MSNAEAKQRPREQSPPLVTVNKLAADLFVRMAVDQRYASNASHIAQTAFELAEAFVAEQQQRLSRE
jgi:hypothetical protein